MQFFTVALLGAVASAVTPYMADVTQVTYHSISAVDNSCMKVKDCAALDKKDNVTHADFEKCLKAASNKCEFSAKVNNIFTEEYTFGDNTATLLFQSCSTAETNGPKRYGINMANVLKVAELAHGNVDDVKFGGSITVTMNAKPTQGDSAIMVKSSGYTAQCPTDLNFDAFDDVPFTGAEATVSDSTSSTEDVTPKSYILTIKAEDALKENGLFFRGDTASVFQKADFSQVTFDTKVKGSHSTEGAFGVFASSALVSLGLTYFAF